jgi:hypothetical protein
MPPEMVHGLQFWSGTRPQPEFDVPCSGHLPTLRGSMRRSTIFAQHDVPSSPLRPSHRQEGLRGVLLPRGCEQQCERACPSGEGAVAHAPGPMPGHGDADRLPKSTVATRSGWGFRHDRLIQHQSHCTPPACTAPFEPPFACRHVGARRARSSRGRCPAMPRRAMASPTLRREAWMCWTARRDGLHKGAVHTVAG